MPTRRLLSWLFALALLFGQGAAFAHTLTHLHAQDPGLPDKVCEVCLAQVQLGAAVPPTPPVIACVPGALSLVAPPVIALAPPARIVVRARAPPVTSV